MKKYVTFSFDDAENYDLRLAALLNKYGIKATFFIITNQIGKKIPHHRYGQDTIVERVTVDDIKNRYPNMEIASHTSSHCGCIKIDDDFIEKEIKTSFKLLSDITGDECIGMAYPGGSYDLESVNKLKENGVLYARTIDVTCNFKLPEDFLIWNPTCAFTDDRCPELVHEFINSDCDDVQLLNIYGHSYELENPNKDWWKFFEDEICRPLAANNVTFATYKEIYNMFGSENR